MPDFLHPQNDFLRKVIAIVEENLTDEDFSVEELSERMSMSRSNLLRKVKTLSGVSVSVFIRKVRLHHAKEKLGEEGVTASEISYQVGFSSTSYFTKCFREEFGHTPGEGKKVELLTDVNESDSHEEVGKRKMPVWSYVLVASVIVLLIFNMIRKEEAKQLSLEKTIAVLPFKNDSNDSTNLYIINGLMESILDNLQKIKELDVTSRTSVEKYRNLPKTIRELSEELEVNYFVEGSGQKVGDQILLTVQLIDARSDTHVWSKQYARETSDIFQLQMEVAKNIAEEIEVFITPDEQRRLEKIPTQDLVAYDFYLKGKEMINGDTYDDLLEAIKYFQGAITEDAEFAHPYAYIAICYYYLDLFQANKQYGLEINTYADKAILFDSELPEGLIAKALFYMQDEQYELAIEFFEKVLTYSPNSGWVHNFLASIYANYIPDTKKYLGHALRGIRVAISDQDSVEASFTYLHLSNALVQTGFIKESEEYIQKSLDYNPQNLFSEYLYSYIRFAQHSDPARTREELISTLSKDSTRLDIIQEIAKMSYAMSDYQTSWEYYEKFIAIKHMFDLDIYNAEDIKIGYVLMQLNQSEQAEKHLSAFKEYAENDPSIYKDFNLSSYYATIGNVEKGIEYLKAFAKQTDYMYWIVLLEGDPIISTMSEHPDYEETLKLIVENFWLEHQKTRKLLEEEGVL